MRVLQQPEEWLPDHELSALPNTPGQQAHGGSIIACSGQLSACHDKVAK